MKIGEVVEAAKRDLAAYEVIASKYSDAEMTRLPNGERALVSIDTTPTRIRFVPFEHEGGISVRACAYEVVDAKAGLYVYCHPSTWRDADILFERLRLREPEAYKLILDTWE